MFGERTYLTDTTFIHPTSPSYARITARSPTAVSKARESRKHTRYDEKAERANMTFVPLVYQTFGGRGSELTIFRKDMAIRASSRPCALMDRDGYYRRFTQLVAIQAQRGNALVQEQGAQRHRMREVTLSDTNVRQQSGSV